MNLNIPWYTSLNNPISSKKRKKQNEKDADTELENDKDREKGKDSDRERGKQCGESEQKKDENGDSNPSKGRLISRTMKKERDTIDKPIVKPLPSFFTPDAALLGRRLRRPPTTPLTVTESLRSYLCANAATIHIANEEEEEEEEEEEDDTAAADGGGGAGRASTLPTHALSSTNVSHETCRSTIPILPSDRPDITVSTTLHAEKAARIFREGQEEVSQQSKENEYNALPRAYLSQTDIDTILKPHLPVCVSGHGTEGHNIGEGPTQSVTGMI